MIVSNHGGRQVDGAVAALDALIEVRDALPQGVVLMDGGIRCAADVVKAVALGADAVLLGRPYAYALAVGGQRGVEELIQNLMAELDLTLALAGVASVRDLDRSWLTSASSSSEPGRVALEEIRVDEPETGEVLVRIEATGVCHSDQHVIDEDGWGHPFPVLLGHEGAGSVVGVGAGVDALSIGDRVVIGWKASCGTCAACLRGAPRRCRKPPAAAGRLHRADGTVLTPVLRTGTFATHTVVPAAAAVRVPSELPFEQACLIGCAVATGVMSVLETAKVWAGARVAVIGCGAVGLSVIQGARIAGARRRSARSIAIRASSSSRAASAPRMSSRGRSTSSSTWSDDARPSNKVCLCSRPAARTCSSDCRLRASGPTSTCPGSSRSEPRSSSRTAATISRRRTSRGSRGSPSTASSISRGW